MISFSSYHDAKRSENTRASVRTCFRRFFHWVNAGEVDDLDAFSLSYLNSGRNYFSDIYSYLDYLIAEGYSPNSIHNSLTYVTHWLRWNEITFTPLQHSMLKNRMPRVVSVRDEDVFDMEKIKSLLSHADIYIRALVLVLVSSGMRIGEALSFDVTQIRGNEIHMRHDQMKARKPHIYFISAEALAALGEWQKVRPEALRRARVKTSRCLGSGEVSNAPIFFYSYTVTSKKFRLAMQKAGLYEKDAATNWGRLTIHGLRKFTDSTMKGRGGLSANLANALIGHFEAGDVAYRRYSREELRAAYSKVEPYLTIQAPENYAELQNETQRQLSNHDKLLVSLVEDNLRIKKELERYQRLLALLED